MDASDVVDAFRVCSRQPRDIAAEPGYAQKVVPASAMTAPSLASAYRRVLFAAGTCPSARPRGSEPTGTWGGRDGRLYLLESLTGAKKQIPAHCEVHPLSLAEVVRP